MLLVLGNATCHPNLKFSNVKLAKTTSCTHPTDQSVINTLKSCYRHLVLQSLVAKMSTNSSVNDLAKEVMILNAVQSIAAALTITKCFLKAGVIYEKFNENLIMDEVSENLITIQNLCRETDAKVQLTTDDTLITDHIFQSAVELVKNKDDEREREKEEEDDKKKKEEGLMPKTKISNHSQVISPLQDIIHFAV